VIPADLGAELARAISAAVAAGDLPAAARQLTSSGTWRPPPGSPPGSYATSLPFQVAGLSGAQPRAVAALLAGALGEAGWIAAAEPTGNGYLTIAVAAPALASLAVRISRARFPEATLPLPDLAAAPTWPQAWRDQATALTRRLEQAAGSAPASTFHSERKTPASALAPSSRGPVAAAVAYAGADAVRYGLSRIPPGRAGGPEREISVSGSTGKRYEAVIFAHSDTASVLRWAADLGLDRAEPDERLAGLLGELPERVLLTRLSWLAERVAGGARRARPDELPRYLEEVAGAWQGCRESCPALPFGGRAAPREAAGISARLWLAAATHAVLAAGLGLIGVSSPERRQAGPVTQGL
jgi:arginyl-tRNA synthetase